MNIIEYAQTRCKDILDKYNESMQYDIFQGMPFDEIEEVDGVMVKVVTCADGNIPIHDILGMDRKEFSRFYPSEVQLDAYDRYVSSITLLEGAEALTAIRDKISKQSEYLYHFDKEKDDILV